MNRSNFISLFLICCALTISAKAQIVGLYSNASRRIYIKGPDSSCTNLIWSNVGYGNECTRLNEIEGFSIEKNLVATSKENKQCIKIQIYSDCKVIAMGNKDPANYMTINLIFEHLAKRSDYFLKIPYIQKGKTLNVVVPKSYSDSIIGDSCCKTLVILSHPPLAKLIDISKIVFPINH